MVQVWPAAYAAYSLHCCSGLCSPVIIDHHVDALSASLWEQQLLHTARVDSIHLSSVLIMSVHCQHHNMCGICCGCLLLASAMPVPTLLIEHVTVWLQ